MLHKGMNPVEVLKRCRDEGFSSAVDVGLHPNDLDERMSLYADVDRIWFSSGLAPAEAERDDWRNSLPKLKQQATSKSIIAVGEIGLDWFWNYGTKKSQMDLLNEQLEIAIETELPVIIHNREADEDTIALLKAADLPARGVMHCFSSDYEFASRCIDLGFMISFAGNVTYKKNMQIQRAAEQIPLAFMLIETDSPYMSPQARRGKPNSPEHIHHTYQFIADRRNISLEAVSTQVYSNFNTVFKL
jgi:TatD DNase family protein